MTWTCELVVFDTIKFEGRAGGTVCCVGGWEGRGKGEEKGKRESRGWKRRKKEKEVGGGGGEGSEGQMLFADY